MLYNKTVFLWLSLFLFFGCKTKKDKILGQTFHYASDNFKIIDSLTLNKQSITFSVDDPQKLGWEVVQDSIIFTAKFNEKVTTKVTIRGLESGAVRVLNIDAKELDGLNASWFGEHQGFDFFRKEKVLVSYEVLGVGEIRAPDTVVIEGPHLFRSGRNFALPGWSFEKQNGSESDRYDEDIASPFVQPYGQEYNISKPVKINTPNGLYAYKFESTETNKSGFLRMGVSFLTVDNPKARKKYKYFINQANPDSVYFNLFVYSESPKYERKLVVVLGETDQGEILDDNRFLVKSSEHNRLSHDRKLLNITMDFTGWKLFSFRYSDMPFATNKFYGGNGNKINEPQSVSIVDFNLETDFPGKHFVYVDFPIFTYGGPFDPTKLK